MESPLIKRLAKKVEELKSEGVPEVSIINALKEDLQYYLLNFIYKSKDYSHFVMYGGSILRIGYELPRMSEDLDFQSAREVDTAKLKSDIAGHFKKTYNIEVDVRLKDRPHFETKMGKVVFDILPEFDLDTAKKNLDVRIDINIFPSAGDFVNDAIPINRDELSFTIKTYPLSTLMASKAIAFLERTDRDIDGKKTNCKPRDVYDMMWYMQQRVQPDLEYMKAKGLAFSTFLDLRDEIIKRADGLQDNLFKRDLAQFFYRLSDFENWFDGWRDRFFQLLKEYEAYEIDELVDIRILVDWSTEVTHIKYNYSVKDGKDVVSFIVSLSDYWYDFSDIKIDTGNRVVEVETKIKMVGDKELRDYDYEYVGLFYKKIEEYLKRVHMVIPQKKFETKLIRATSEDLNVKKQIFLNKRLLRKVQFEELL